MSASGAVKWTADGVALGTATGNQYMQSMVPDGSGGAVVAWEDERSGNKDIYAQRLGADGRLGGPVAGVAAPGVPGLALALGSANPARGSAVLRWSLPADADVRLVVCDVAGRVVRVLACGRQGAGEHRTAWDGCDGAGAPMSAGLYLAHLEAGGRSLSVRLALVR